MYIGHYGVAFGLRSLGERDNPGLGAHFFAVQFLDVVFGVLAALGIESVQFNPASGGTLPYEGNFPWSHSLAGSLIWTALLGGIFLLWRGRRAGALIALGVFSHFILDFIMHSGNVRLLPHGPGYGLGLYRWIPVDVALELTLFLAGLALYLRSGAAYERHRLARLTAFLILSHGAMVLPIAHTPDVSLVPLMAPYFAALAIWAWRVEIPS